MWIPTEILPSARTPKLRIVVWWFHGAEDWPTCRRWSCWRTRPRISSTHRAIPTLPSCGAIPPSSSKQGEEQENPERLVGATGDRLTAADDAARGAGVAGVAAGTGAAAGTAAGTATG